MEKGFTTGLMARNMWEVLRQERCMDMVLSLHQEESNMKAILLMIKKTDME